jgi:hypothetical protein
VQIELSDRAELERASGKKETLVFDAGTMLLLSRTVKQRTPVGEIDVTVEYSDYRKVDDVMVAFKFVQSYGAAKVEMTTTSIKHNTNVADDVFMKE